MLQQAVDAEAHPQPALDRLQVDVGGAAIDGHAQELAHDLVGAVHAPATRGAAVERLLLGDDVDVLAGVQARVDLGPVQALERTGDRPAWSDHLDAQPALQVVTTRAIVGRPWRPPACWTRGPAERQGT